MGGLGGVGVAGGVGKGGGCAKSTCAKLDEECAEECEPCAKLDEECAEDCEPGDGGGRGCRCAAPEAMLGSGAGGAAFAGCLGTAGGGDGAKSTSAKLAEECADECEPGDGGVGRWRGGAASGAAFPERSAFRPAFLFGPVGFRHPLHKNILLTKKAEWKSEKICRAENDGADTFRSRLASRRPRLFNPSSPNMGSLNQGDFSLFERTMSA